MNQIPPSTAQDTDAALEGIAYEIRVNAAAAYFDVNERLHVRGEIFNRGERTIVIGGQDSQFDFIGARVFGSDGQLLTGIEACAAIPGGILSPGRGAPFAMTFPPVGPTLGAATIEFSLVRENAFWIGDRGLPSVTLVFSSPPQMVEVHSQAEAVSTDTIGQEAAAYEPVDRQSALKAFKDARAGLDQKATLDDLWYCFRLFFNRVPDENGFEYFSSLIRSGTSITALTHLFLSSGEFLARLDQPEHIEHVQTRINGIDLYVPMPKTPDEHHILSTGCQKSLFSSALSALLNEGHFVIDVGAGVGEFSTLASRKVGSQGRIIAFEPEPTLTKMLLANITTHAMENIDVLPFAAADGEGFVSLIKRGMLKTCREVTTEDLLGDALVVYARSLDSALPPEQRVDLIRVVLDGFDYRAALGATNLLNRWKPHYFGEYAPGLLDEFSGINPTLYLRFLQDCGYRHFSAISPQHGAIDLGNDIDKLAAMPARLGTAAVDFCASA